MTSFLPRLRDSLAQYRLTLAAQQDLRQILRYIARDKLSAAKKMRLLFTEAFVMLAENPNIGSQRHDLTQKPVRFWPVESYHIIYTPDTQPIEITRILSGYRDIAKILS